MWRLLVLSTLAVLEAAPPAECGNCVTEDEDSIMTQIRQHFRENRETAAGVYPPKAWGKYLKNLVDLFHTRCPPCSVLREKNPKLYNMHCVNTDPVDCGGTSATERSVLCKGQSKTLRPLERVYSDNGVLATSLIVDVADFTFPEAGIKLTTRAYNYSFPGPAMFVKRGDRLKINVINRLQATPQSVQQRREGQDELNESNPFFQDVGQNLTSPYQSQMSPSMNNFHNANFTRLHTHGFHISPEGAADNTLDAEVPPGGSFEHIYDISPYQNAGQTWYHPHEHGSTTLQIAGGMAGVIIIQDSEGEVPDYISRMRDEVMIIQEHKWQYFGPDYLNEAPNDFLQGCHPFGSTFTLNCAILGARTLMIKNLTEDDVTNVEILPGFGFDEGQTIPLRTFFTVNGQFSPTMPRIKTGQWIRMRFVYAGHHDAVNLVLEDDDCEMHLIAKDNVFLPVYPRKLNKGIWMGPGNRCQVIVRCKTPGRKALKQQLTDSIIAPLDEELQPLLQTVMWLDVKGPRVWWPLKPPRQVQAQRPRYLNDLRDVDDVDIATPNVSNPTRPAEPIVIVLDDDGKTILVDQAIAPATGPSAEPFDALAYLNYPVRFALNNETYKEGMSDQYQAVLQVGEVYQMRAKGLQFHSWHMHGNPVQIQSFAFAGYKELYGGYMEVGDWADQIVLPKTCDLSFGPFNCPDSDAVVRFQTDCYTGRFLLHCHLLYHNDLGMMTLLRVDGPEHTTNPNFADQGIYQYPPSHCLSPGANCPDPVCVDYDYSGGGSTPAPSYSYSSYGYNTRWKRWLRRFR
ncbi:cueO [Symbiodinium sp. CCMP2592]|nr:cueO [Symbiodinium sp. CCMP2592]